MSSDCARVVPAGRYLLIEAADAGALEFAIRELEAQGHRLVTRIAAHEDGRPERGALLRRWRPPWRKGWRDV